MPAPTYDLIEEQVLGSAQASVTFSSIPGTYKDLVLEATATCASLQQLIVRFNSDSGTNYSWTRVLGNGSAASSTRATNDTATIFGFADSTQGVSLMQIMSYANTNVNKSTLSRINLAGGYVGAYVNLWRNTNAITSLTITGDNAVNLASGSTFRLWGVAG